MPSYRAVSALVVLLAVATLVSGAARAVDPPVDPPVTPHGSIKASLEELSVLGKATDHSYAPFRRGTPADTAAWAALGELHAAVGRVAVAARGLRGQVDALRDDSDLELAVSRGEFRRRLALADSLIGEAEQVAALDWRAGRPEDLEEAAGWAVRRARYAKQAADRAVAAAGDVAYAVGVTEGVGKRTLNLSLVGIVVVFAVLSLIALVVGLIRRLDDGWQVREEAAAAAALSREPTIDETTVVLIAAACATVITGRHRVRRIRRLLSPTQKRTPWSAQGRLILQGSHTVDRKSN